MNEEVFKIYGSILLKDEEFIKGMKQALNLGEDTATKLSKKFESIGNTFSKIGQGITKAGTVMTATLTTGILGLATAGIKYNAQMETFEANLTTLLGSADEANKLLSDLQELASTTPYETDDLISATQTMIGFGISAKDAQDYLSVLGDIAMGNSEKLGGLALAFSQVQSTGRLTGQDLLQMINQGFNPLLYISKMTGKSMATLKEEMSEGAISAEMVAQAFQYATQEGQPFYNAMEKGADTVNGRISTLKDNFNILIGKLTESLLPVFEKVVDKLIELTEKFSNLDEAQRNQILKWGAIVASIGPVLIVLGKLSSGLGVVFGGLSKLAQMKSVTAVVGKFSTACGGTVGALGAVAGIVALVASVFVFLKRHWDKVTKVFDNFVKRTKLAEKFEEIKAKLQPLAEKFKGLGDLFEVVGGFIVAILQPAIAILAGLFDGVVSAIAPLLDALGGVLDVLGGIGTFIKSVLTGDMEGAKNALSQIGQGIVDIFAGLWDAVVGFLQGFKEGIESWVQSLFDTLGITEFLNNVKIAISNWWDGVVAWLQGAWNTICNVVDVGIQLIGSIIDGAIQIITLPFRFIWENCKEHIMAFVNKAKELIGNVVSWIVEKFNALKAQVVSIWNLIKQYIIQPIVDAYNKVKEVIGNIVSWISEKFNSLKTKTTNTFSEIKNGIVSKITELKSKVTTIFNNIKTAMETPINNAKEAIRKVVEQIKGFFSGMKLELPNIKLPHFKIDGKLSIDPPSVPKLKIDWYKDGGIFAKPTLFNTNNGVKGVGEAGPEAVAPISKLQEYVKVAVQNSNSVMEAKLETLINILTEYLPALQNQQMVLDTGVLVGELAMPLDEELGRIENRKGRGR